MGVILALYSVSDTMKQPSPFPKEHVLVFAASTLDKVGYFQGVRFDVERYLAAILDPVVSEFLPREAAETNPGYKQIIPYVILKHEKKVFRYRRPLTASEPRLHGSLTVGVGGHIKLTDEKILFANPQRGYQDGLVREINEEVTISCPYDDHPVAVINDDSDDVGRVHFGVVHVFELEQPAVTTRDRRSLSKRKFLTLEELVAEVGLHESWSRLCITRVLPRYIGRLR